MARLGMISRIFIIAYLSAVVFAQLPDDGFRRCGQQGAYVNHTVWLVGGYEVSLTDNGSRLAPNLTQINLSVNFTIPGTFNASQLPKLPEVPDVSYGTLWSNEIDTLWLYGGQDVEDEDTPNTIWRCKLHSALEGDWSQVDPVAANLTGLRRTDGAGCNVPSQSTAYYLGGRSGLNTTASGVPQYFHSMVVFDMESETTSVIDVPDFVPIIGQSLVYMDVTLEGILIALGGKTEMNGSLTPASLAEIYIYDIASNSWAVQQTTDTLRRSDHFYGAYDQYEAGIPNPRWDMCAVAGVAPDATSYNVYVLGGGNETMTPGDIWALSLPSAVWIRMNTTDLTNNPKRASSCNLLDSRYVLMADGCWGAASGPCYSYGWNPLLYDIAIGNWGWTFDPAVEGYFIPEQIHSIIGGSADGGAVHTTPMYTNFSNSLVASVFAPPTDFGASSWLRALRWTVVSVVISGVALWTITESLQRLIERRQSRSLNQEISLNEQNWKPWPMKAAFLSVILIYTVSLIIVIRMVLHISSLPDDVRAHWTGGIESEGTWSGQRWASVFTPAPGEGIPVRGLVSFYHDTQPFGSWSERNASQRMGVAIYILWTYIPSVIAVLYGLLWTILDGEVKRIEKYYHLTSPGGASGKDTICLDYHSFWSPLAIVQALMFRQWTVALSSTGSTVAVIAVPNIQNYVFNWVIYSGGRLNWGGVYSWQVGVVDSYWANVLTGVLCVDLLCLVGLISLLHRRRSGLQQDPRGIITWVQVTLSSGGESIFGLGPADSFAPESQIYSKVKNKRLQISTGLARELRVVGDDHSPDHSADRWRKFIPKPFQHPLAKVGRIWKHSAKFVMHIYEVVSSWTTRYASNMLHPLLLVPWMLWLVVSLCANLYVLAEMTSSEQLTLSNYALPWSPDIYLVVGVLIQTIYQVFERNIRAMIIFDTLRQGYQHPGVLWEDFTYGHPVIEILQAFDKQQHLLGYVLLGSVATTIYTIMLGSLQVSASFYGAADFKGDLAGVITTCVINFFILVVTCTGAWRYARARILPRYPGTVASWLPYILSSEKLKEDCREVFQTCQDKKEQIKALQQKGRRYGFGQFCNEGSMSLRLGIERNGSSALDGVEFLRPWK